MKKFSGRVGGNIEQIDQEIKASGAELHKIGASTGELVELAASLQNLVKKFKISA